MPWCSALSPIVSGLGLCCPLPGPFCARRIYESRRGDPPALCNSPCVSPPGAAGLRIGKEQACDGSVSRLHPLTWRNAIEERHIGRHSQRLTEALPFYGIERPDLRFYGIGTWRNGQSIGGVAQPPRRLRLLELSGVVRSFHVEPRYFWQGADHRRIVSEMPIRNTPRSLIRMGPTTCVKDILQRTINRLRCLGKLARVPRAA